MKYWRSTLFVVFSASFVSALAQQSGSSARSTARPNIIFILTDDQRWDALGYAGNKLIHTPEMDRLAQSGTYFSHAMVTTPICAASRASLLTGLYERTHGFNFQTGDIRSEHMQQAYPKVLKDAGYYTGFYGKFGVLYPDKDQLFDVYEDYDRNNAFKDKRGYYYKTIGKDTVHLTRYTGQQALDFIDQVPSKQPFCLSLSFSAPHAHDGATEQYFWQPETDSLLQDRTMPGPLLGEDRFFEALPEKVRTGFNRLRWTWRYDTPEKYQHSIKGYYRMISGVDLEIGKIRRQLKQNGLDQNTIIILMGDNGYFLGERQLAGKWLLYDNSIRVPLIIYDPRINHHQDLDDMAMNIDVPPTILDFAGVKAPKSWQGKTLRPMVAGTSVHPLRDTVLIEHIWEFDHIPPSEGVRTTDWKYFRYVNDKSIEELYDLKTDPTEIRNLAGDKQFEANLNGLRAKTDVLIKKYEDPYAGMPGSLRLQRIQQGSASLPGYSWVNSRRTVKQSAYQILVASSKANIDKNIGDVWNSGQVKSDKHTTIVHQGTGLRPSMDLYWKVRVWDEDNRLGEYAIAQHFQFK